MEIRVIFENIQLILCRLEEQAELVQYISCFYSGEEANVRYNPLSCRYCDRIVFSRDSIQLLRHSSYRSD